MQKLIIAALAPAVLLMIYIFSRDRVEKEPLGLLARLAVFGALACLPAALLEEGLLHILAGLSLSEADALLVEAFLIVALSEEGCKLVILHLQTWRSREFDYRFDGIVYAAFVSLGFAALENVLYLLRSGLSIALSRAMFAVPGHLTFSIFMGFFYVCAKDAALRGKYGRSVFYRLAALVAPMLLHGFYDYCLMSGTDEMYRIFLGFVILLDLAAYGIVRRQSRCDRPLRRSNSAFWE
jgi:RsiW-degrading membrane proteinase PrsW (M82 family)